MFDIEIGDNLAALLLLLDGLGTRELVVEIE